MKKLLATILVLLLITSLFACNKTEENNTNTTNVTPTSDYNYNPDASCDWSGSYVRKTKNENISTVLEIGQGDSSSFEFSITVDDKGDVELIGGYAFITGNKATFKEENGRSVEFIMGNNGNIDVKRIRENGKTDKKGNVTGEYIFTNI